MRFSPVSARLTSVVDAVVTAAVAVRVAAVAEVGAAGSLAAPIACGRLPRVQRETGAAPAVQPPRGPRQAATCRTDAHRQTSVLICVLCVS